MEDGFWGEHSFAVLQGFQISPEFSGGVDVFCMGFASGSVLAFQASLVCMACIGSGLRWSRKISQPWETTQISGKNRIFVSSLVFHHIQNTFGAATSQKGQSSSPATVLRPPFPLSIYHVIRPPRPLTCLFLQGPHDLPHPHARTGLPPSSF